MSLLSPFSPFSPGEGVGSKALTHQQVSFSPFISSLSSQLPLFFFTSLLSASYFSIHLPCLFVCVPSLHLFAFSFNLPFAPCCPLSYHLCSISLSLSLLFSILVLFPPLVPLLHHFPCPHCLLLIHSFIVTPPLLPFHLPLSFTLFSLSLLLPSQIHHLCFSPNVSLF